VEAAVYVIAGRRVATGTKAVYVSMAGRRSAKLWRQQVYVTWQAEEDNARIAEAAVLCEHGRQKSRCKECGGNSLCEHGRQKAMQGVEAVYVSMAGRRANARSVEAAVYVMSIAGRRVIWEWRQCL
jgi:DNA-binding cell septation regulator SpoVG